MTLLIVNVCAFANWTKKLPQHVGGMSWHHAKFHDFPLPELGKAAPYGIYDISANEGYVSVGISSDTAQFAVASIRNWWYSMGIERYPNAPKLLITADGGGSNGSRNRLWKTELQNLANETGLEISVCHFPPGTSKSLFRIFTKEKKGSKIREKEKRWKKWEMNIRAI